MTGRRGFQLFHSFEDFQAGSWSHARRIITKVEFTKLAYLLHALLREAQCEAAKQCSAETAADEKSRLKKQHRAFAQFMGLVRRFDRMSRDKKWHCCRSSTGIRQNHKVPLIGFNNSIPSHVHDNPRLSSRTCMTSC